MQFVMICDLDIRDFISIEHLTLELPAGLVAITGETGAGKSVLLSALEAAFGGQVRKDWVRKGADQASISVRLLLPASHPAWNELEKAGYPIDRGEPLVLRRTLRPSRPSRAFIQDQSASAAMLAEIGRSLSDFSTQHQQIELFRATTHGPALDRFGGLESLASEVSNAWKNWQRVQAACDRLADRTRADEEAREHLEAQCALLEELAPEEGEVERLELERRQLKALHNHAEHLSEALGAVADGVEERLVRGATALTAATRKGDTSPQLQDAVAAVETALTMVQSAETVLSQELEGLEQSAQRLEGIDRRLLELKDGARRIGCTPETIAVAGEELFRRRDEWSHAGDQLDRAQVQLAAAREHFEALAGRLRAGRERAALELSEKVEAELRRLKLGHARFDVKLSPTDPGPAGCDAITFCLSTSPALAPVALGETASGGEISRIALALKLVLASSRAHQVHVFDEIDQGVGGAVATAMGERLQRLARTGQVIAVTHSPQLAALADGHLKLHREIGDNGLGHSRIDSLDAQARVDEIARMVSGKRVTREARAAAVRLLGDGGSGKSRQKDRGLARAGA